jgi:hypothetical protein
MGEPVPEPAVASSVSGDQTKLSYSGPRELAARYDLSDDLATKLTGSDGITDAVVDG